MILFMRGQHQIQNKIKLFYFYKEQSIITAIKQIRIYKIQDITEVIQQYTNINVIGKSAKISQMIMIGIPSQIDAQFCYMIVKDISSAALYALYGISIIVLTILMIKQCRQYNYAQLQNRILKKVYIFLFLWSFIAGLEIILAEVFYAWAAFKSNQQTINFNMLSKYIFFVTFLNLYLFQTALFIAIYFWLKSVILYCSHSKEIVDTVITQQLQHRFLPQSSNKNAKSQMEVILAKTAKIYLYVRVLVLGLWFPFYFLPSQIQTVRSMALLFLYFMLIDSLISFLFLVMSLIAVKRKKLQLNKIYSKLSTNIRKMMFPTFFRIFMLITNILSPYFDLHKDYEDCQLQNKAQFLPYGLLALGGIGIYVFPYIVFLLSLRESSNLNSKNLAGRQSDHNQIFLSQ